MRPISGGFNPYDRSAPPHRGPSAVERAAALRVVRSADVAPVAPREPDVELSVRLLADGGSISVQRRTVAQPDGTRRTVGIDAIVR